MWTVDNKIQNDRHMKIRIVRGLVRAPGTWAECWWLKKIWMSGRKKKRGPKTCMKFGLSMVWGRGEWGKSLEMIMFMSDNVPRASKEQEGGKEMCLFSVNIVGINTLIILSEFLKTKWH